MRPRWLRRRRRLTLKPGCTSRLLSPGLTAVFGVIVAACYLRQARASNAPTTSVPSLAPTSSVPSNAPTSAPTTSVPQGTTQVHVVFEEVRRFTYQHNFALSPRLWRDGKTLLPRYTGTDKV